MPIQDVTPEQAHALRQDDATIPYLDVRSVPEFQRGHPAGAYNIPIMHLDPIQRQMRPNPDFERVVQATFAVDQTLIVGCQVGNRSAHAAAHMEQLGFQDLRNVAGGFGGGEDEYGEPVRGWEDCGLPVARASEDGHDYESLLSRAP